VGRRLELVFQPPAGAKRRKNFAMRSNELVEAPLLSGNLGQSRVISGDLG